MTPFSDIYKRFFAKIKDDEWEGWEDKEILEDLEGLLEEAIADFNFPQTSLETAENGFIEKLNLQEQEILATFMKCAWLNRNVLTWENIRAQYDERDFSQANMLSKFTVLLAQERSNARKLLNKYYRTKEPGVPFDYSGLAGKKNE